MVSDQRRRLPAVETLLRELEHTNGQPAVPHSVALEAARTVLAEARAGVQEGDEPPTVVELAERARAVAMEAGRPSLRRVVNASGVILQTNLGRAPLSERAIAAMDEVARGYSNLEFDLDAGGRGSRHEHVRELIRRTTGAEDGIVVNNNAAALLMVLQVFAQGREVIVSRGQAVEIGGGFRIPDVLRQSGARLVEVGTTNRTYTRDYAEAWGEETAAILRVHASNFKVVGFTAEASLGELADTAHRRGGWLFDDLGSGCLVATERFGLAHEPTVQESFAAGSDLTLFSGDKLLGGPQCGIIAGRTALVARLRAHPLARALRVDKLTIAALNATLMAYVEQREAEELPVWRMLSADLGTLRRRAGRWARIAGPAGSVVSDRSMVGGGSLPGQGVPTWCAAIRPARGEERLAAALRAGEPAIVGRLAEGALLLDPRTVQPGEDAALANALRSAMAALE
jgi:L-seryl-tRNA(Ser) seleniumtransferase